MENKTRFIVMDQEFAKQLGIDSEEQHILDIGASHPYNCTCETCMKYWELMPPEEE